MKCEIRKGVMVSIVEPWHRVTLQRAQDDTSHFDLACRQAGIRISHFLKK